MSIDQLRQSMRARRRQFGMGAQCRFAHQLLAAIETLPIYQCSQRVGVYLAVDGELSCSALIKRSWRLGKQCYLPVLRPFSIDSSASPMLFAHYSPGMVLTKNRYGIDEPPVAGAIVPAELDLVIVPLVACDMQGNRVGMGGGYYDRSFAFIRDMSKGHHSFTTGRPWLLGVGFRTQQVECIEPQAWDVTLDQTIVV